MFSLAGERSTKLCNMKPLNYLLPSYISVKGSSPPGDEVLGTKTFLFSSVLWRVIVQFTSKKEGRIEPGPVAS